MKYVTAAWGAFLLSVPWFWTTSCGDSTSSPSSLRGEEHLSLKTRWDYQNAPERIGLVNNHYEMALNRLPSSGDISVKPWSDSYWPSYLGGVSYRWHAPSSSTTYSRSYYTLEPMESVTSGALQYLSPAEKYDFLLGDSLYGITQSERSRTQVMSQLSGTQVARWQGLCHGWAAGSMIFKEPGPVTVVSSRGQVIPFGASDIKALLTLFLHANSGQSFIVSRRCNVDERALRRQWESGVISRGEYERQMKAAACEGIHAGAFHIILTNLIGLRQEGFIADLTRGVEVWNQPIYGYTSHVLETRHEDLSQDAASGTVTEVKISTQMRYIFEVGPTWDKSDPSKGERTVTYLYWLELNERGEIIGGHWESEARPDFLWKRTVPEFHGIWQPLGDLYRLATGVSSDHPVDLGGELSNLSDFKFKYTTHAFRKMLTVSGTFPASVVKAFLEVRDRYGDVTQAIPLQISGRGSFELTQSLWHWYGTSLLIAGYDEQGRKVSETHRRMK